MYWEYRFKTVLVAPSASDDDQVEGWLNSMSGEGWQLVAALPALENQPPTGLASYGIRFILKRRKQEW